MGKPEATGTAETTEALAELTERAFNAVKNLMENFPLEEVFQNKSNKSIVYPNKVETLVSNEYEKSIVTEFNFDKKSFSCTSKEFRNFNIKKSYGGYIITLRDISFNLSRNGIDVLSEFYPSTPEFLPTAVLAEINEFYSVCKKAAHINQEVSIRSDQVGKAIE